MRYPPIVSSQIRLRKPDLLVMGEGSVVDDFCYISAQLRIGRFVHIASGCSIAGGEHRTCSIGDFTSLSSGVKIWCTSNDFVNDLVALLPPELQEIGDNKITGDVVIERYCGIGANSVVMPQTLIPEGCTIGALSFVPATATLEPWTVYAGTPVRAVASRNRGSVLAQVRRIEAGLNTAKPTGD